jgi:hypothetical protein
MPISKFYCTADVRKAKIAESMMAISINYNDLRLPRKNRCNPLRMFFYADVSFQK